MTTVLSIETIKKMKNFLSVDGKTINLCCLVKRGTNSFTDIKNSTACVIQDMKINDTASPYCLKIQLLMKAK